MTNPRPAARLAHGVAALALLACASALPAEAQSTDADQACGRHLPGERLLRPLLRHLSQAKNRPGETPFHAAPGTPTVNGLSGRCSPTIPNAANPVPAVARAGGDLRQDHDYTPEQQAFDGGLMDKFVEFTRAYPGSRAAMPNVVMGYFDGNTVTALWNYAQHFAMSDNSFGTTFGPSTPGAINLVSGKTHGATPADLKVDDNVVIVAGHRDRRSRSAIRRLRQSQGGPGRP